MKKRTGLVIAIFLIIIALIPLLQGMIFKRHYLQLIDHINQDNRVKIDLIEYDEGWFHSNAKIHVTINKALLDIYQLTSNAPHAHLDFVVDEKIIHGPVIYDSLLGNIEFGYARINSDIFLANILQTVLFGTVTSKGLFQVSMLSEFDGDWSGHILVPSISLGLYDVGVIAWKGLVSNFKIVEGSSYIKLIKLNGTIDSLSFQGNEKNLQISKAELQPLNFQYKMRHDDTGLTSGTSTIWTKGASITKSDGASYQLEKLAVRTVLSMGQDQIYNTNLSLNAGKLISPNNVFPEITEFHFSVNANNFTTQGLYDFINQFKADTPEAMRAVDLNALQNLLAHTMTPTSVVNADLSLNSSLGAFTSQLNSTWLPNVSMPNTLYDIFSSANTKIHLIISPGVALKFAEIYNKIDEVMAANIQNYQSTPVAQPATPETPQQLLDEFAMAGFLNKDEYNNYETKLTIQSGIWKLNDRPLN